MRGAGNSPLSSGVDVKRGTPMHSTATRFSFATDFGAITLGGAGLFFAILWSNTIHSADQVAPHCAPGYTAFDDFDISFEDGNHPPHDVAWLTTAQMIYRPIDELHERPVLPDLLAPTVTRAVVDLAPKQGPPSAF